MAVFIPVAVIASTFLADSVTAAPIIDASYATGQYELDDEKMASIFSSLGKLLGKNGVKEGILGTFGALAGGIGSVLGATGGNNKRSFDEWDDDEKMAGLLSILAKPGVKEGILGTFGAIAGGIGSVLGATGGNNKRSFDELDDDEKMASIFTSLGKLLGKNGVKEGILGTFGALAGGIGSVLGATGGNNKRGYEIDMTDEEKIASFWKYIPSIAGAIGGVLGLGAGAAQHVQNGKEKRDIEELTSLIARQLQDDSMTDEEKIASFWKYIPHIAGALGGVLGLGAGAAQHVQNGKEKRAMHSHEIQQMFTLKGLKTMFGIDKRDLEDMELMARMIDDSEFY